MPRLVKIAWMYHELQGGLNGVESMSVLYRLITFGRAELVLVFLKPREGQTFSLFHVLLTSD